MTSVSHRTVGGGVVVVGKGWGWVGHLVSNRGKCKFKTSSPSKKIAGGETAVGSLHQLACVLRLGHGWLLMWMRPSRLRSARGDADHILESLLLTQRHEDTAPRCKRSSATWQSWVNHLLSGAIAAQPSGLLGGTVERPVDVTMMLLLSKSYKPQNPNGTSTNLSSSGSFI